MDKGMGYFNYPELYAQPLAVAVGVGSIQLKPYAMDSPQEVGHYSSKMGGWKENAQNRRCVQQITELFSCVSPFPGQGDCIQD